MPDFSVEAILRAEPDLRSQAVAILEGKPPLQKILGVNEAARRAGLTPGMTKLQAEVCDGITLRERSQLQESAAHQALLDCAQSFSPRVEDSASDTLLLDLSGLDKLFGPLPRIAREISRRACDMGLQVNVAAAFTIEAALLAARGFSGVTVVPEGKEVETMGPLSVEVLLSSETEPADAAELSETFRRWGIHKFRELAALPEVELSERLGQDGLELHQRARGQSQRTLVPSDPPLQFEEVLELEFPLVLLEPLAFVLNRMVEQLCARLQARALAAQELHLELTLENGRRLRVESGDDSGEEYVNSVALFRRVIHLPVPLLEAKTFLKLLQLDLRAHPPGAPVRKVTLRIEPAKPRPSQNGLFCPSSPEPEKLELTLAKISGIVGEGRAGSPALLDTHRHGAFEMQRFNPFAQKTPSPRVPADLVTALRIFRPPVVVTVDYANGKPMKIESATRREISGEVLWAAGPWRSSGDWWEQDAWVHDEWDIAVQQNREIILYRLIHDLIGRKWVLEGTYD
ncbi:MAG TPA: DNA polymerase Y family protein [Terriglobales bacterium]